MKKKLLFLILAITGILMSSTPVFAINQATSEIIKTETALNPDYVLSNNFKLYINGELKNIENTYVVVEGRTFLPMREVANLLGANVSWDNENNVASLETDSTLIEIPIGRTRASVNNQIKDLGDTRSLKIETSTGGATYLPLRFLADNLGYNVKYYSDTSVIHIYNTETEPTINNTVTTTQTNNNVTTTPTQSTSAKTEEQVIAKINELKARYPENSQWETSDIYNSSYDFNGGFYDSMTYGQGSYKTNAKGTTTNAKDCAAWAMWVSDQIFGNAPTTKHSNYNAIKVGDLIHLGEENNNTNGSHWIVVVDIKYNENGDKYYVVTDSDDTRYVNWGTCTLTEWKYNPNYQRNEMMNNYLGKYATGLPFQIYSRY